MIRMLTIIAVLLITLNGCTLLVGGIVGAAVTPLIQPQVDRALAAVGADFIDPGGVEQVRQYDSKK